MSSARTRWPAVGATVLGLSLAAARSASADSITITFEQPPCAAIASGIYPQDCYAAVGFLLGSDSQVPHVFAIAADPRAVSVPNIARPVAGFTNLRGEFFVPGQGFGVPAVSFNVTGSVPGQAPWEVVFYSMESDLQRISGVSDQVVSLSRGGREILGWTFSVGSPSQGIDNVTFGDVQVAATPEPSTLLLIGTGLAVVARRRRRLP